MPRYASAYQEMKPLIQSIFGLSRDAIHIHVGVACFFAVMWLGRKKPLKIWFLLPGFVLSVLMEIKDLWDDYHLRERLEYMASLHDLLNTNFIPVMMYLLIKLILRDKNQSALR